MAATSTHKNKYGSRSRKLNIIPGLCYYCRTEHNNEISFCESCGFPIKGSEDQQRAFIGKQRKKLSELEDLEKLRRGGTHALILLTALHVIMALFNYFYAQSLADAIVYSVLALIYGGLAYFSKTKPFQALLTGFILYGSLIIFTAIIDPASIFSGIVIKSFMIFAFISGMNSIRKAEKLRKEIEGKNLAGK